MKRSRVLSASLAAALVAAGSLVIASPAMAETHFPGENVTFYDESDFGEEVVNGVWPTNDWFFGHVTPEAEAGTYSFDPFGLTLNGKTQILNQNVGTQPTTAAEFVSALESASATTGFYPNYTLQFPVFAEPSAANVEFTTIRPVETGNPTVDEWEVSQSFGTINAGTIYTLQEISDALFVDEAPELLAYGLFVNTGDVTDVAHFSWMGHTSVFVPVPTRAISATSLSVDEATTTGFTLTGTNWLPDSPVYVYVKDSNGDPVFEEDLTGDVNGNISVTVVLPDGVEPGTYTITFDDDSYFYGLLGVMSDPFTTIELVELLAATGPANTSGFIALAGLLGLAGIGLVGASRRRARA